MASTIIDNTDGGCSLVGTWGTSSYTAGYYGSNYRFAGPAGSGTNTATFLFTGLTPGTPYYLGLTWPGPASYWATNTPWSVLDGVTVIGSGTVNQEVPPGDFTDTAQPWSYLGSFTPTGTTLAIRITDNTNEYAAVDAAILTDALPITPGISRSGDHYADEAAAWVGGLIPTPGVDQVVISLGSTIRVRDQQDWGLDTALPTSSFDVTIHNTGTVIIEDGGTLTLHGHVDVKSHGSTPSAFIDIKDGGKLEFYDAYGIVVGTTLWQYRYIKGRGEFEISTRVGSSSGGYFAFSSDGQGCQCDFVGTDVDHPFRILRMGSASQPWFDTGTTPGNCPVIFENGYTDSCGKINGAGNCASTDVVRFKNFGVFNCLASYDLKLNFIDAPAGSGTCLFEDVTFHKGIDQDSLLPHATFTRPSVHDGAMYFIGTCPVIEDAFIAGSGSSALGANTSRQITRPVIVLKTGSSNEKVIQYQAGATGAWTVDDAIVCPLISTGSDGEYVAAGQLGNSAVATFNRAIFLPFKDGTGMRAVEFNTDYTSRVDFLHGVVSTHGGSNGSSIGIGHSGNDNTVSDRARVKSTIFYNFSTSTNCAKVGWITNDLADCIDPTQVINNCGWGLTTQLQASRYSNPAVGYQQKQTDTSTLPGANDVDVNPWPTRTSLADFPSLAKWATTLGITGTDSQKETKALNAIHARLFPWHADYVAGATGIAFGEYVRNQMKVNNILLATAGHDGEPIGAAGYVAASTGRTGMNNRTLRPY